ncbi:peroxiredoxin family protein [Zavarzinella formosa]|uniref:peroxiredoxin family protein n=1 Tax=Zavarzinella formosa TaxID=360055 RepID=UPI000317C785|nr:redoxin domain-containing protein [Zavarzinella formosa]
MRRFSTTALLVAATAAMAAAFLIQPGTGHPVTPWMADSAQAETGREIPALPGMASDRPTVVIFILPGCPCSEAYEQQTHELFRACGSQAHFIGVVAGDDQEAIEWQREHQTPYLVIADADRSISRGFGAKRSAYTALALDGKTICRLWPGYSAGMLQELGSQIATATGARPFSLQFPDAPATLASGCPLD